MFGAWSVEKILPGEGEDGFLKKIEGTQCSWGNGKLGSSGASGGGKTGKKRLLGAQHNKKKRGEGWRGGWGKSSLGVCRGFWGGDKMNRGRKGPY